MDKATQILLDVLRQGTNGEGEQRLFRSGKLPGLFSGKTSLNAELAAQALRDGLIEMVRTETRGKTAVEWVRVTSQGTAFLVQHESPLKALEELHAVLRQNQEGLPAWFTELQAAHSGRQSKGAGRIPGHEPQAGAIVPARRRHLAAGRSMGPALPNGAAGVVPWSNEAVHISGATTANRHW